MADISRLTEATDAARAEINGLLAQLSGETASAGSMPELQSIIGDKNAYVAVAKDEGRIVGVAFLFIIQKMGKRKAFVESVVVDESQRGKGTGRKLMEELIKAARGNGVSSVELTSRPSRVAANALYQKLGFEKRETNVYRMKL